MIRLRLTCAACPEQYDAFLGEERVGYLRLRHGRFTVECPDVGEDLVYEATPMGDGIFDESERDYYLRFAVHAIEAWLANDRKPLSKPPAPNVTYELDEDDYDFEREEEDKALET